MIVTINWYDVKNHDRNDDDDDNCKSHENDRK